MEPRIFILGIPVDAVTRRGALERIRTMVVSGAQHHIVTPNPEMLVEAVRNPEFAGTLASASLNVPDGAGLLWAARGKLPERVTGTDLLTDVAQTGIGPIFLLGARSGVAEKAAEVLRAMNPSLQIAGTYAGSPKDEEADGIISRINASGASVLFVAYGAPAQDLWIKKHLPSMPGVQIAMGVGGAFDFLSGTVRRAPGWMRRAGLEWLWRVLLEPWRIRRIATATIVFPWMVLTPLRRKSRS